VVTPHEPPCCRCPAAPLLTTGIPVAVCYLGADALAHYRVGRVIAVRGGRFSLAYQDPAGTIRQARYDLANPDDVLAVELAR
jgi:hypothetical protein